MVLSSPADMASISADVGVQRHLSSLVMPHDLSEGSLVAEGAIDSVHRSVSHASNIECIALFDVCVSWHAVVVIDELDLCGSTIVCRYSAFSEIS